MDGLQISKNCRDTLESINSSFKTIREILDKNREENSSLVEETKVLKERVAIAESQTKRIIDVAQQEIKNAYDKGLQAALQTNGSYSGNPEGGTTRENNNTLVLSKN